MATGHGLVLLLLLVTAAVCLAALAPASRAAGAAGAGKGAPAAAGTEASSHAARVGSPGAAPGTGAVSRGKGASYPSESSAVDLFSTRRQEASKTSEFFLDLNVKMPYSKDEFDVGKQDTFTEAIASAAGISPLNVNILSITEGRRRGGSVNVETKLRTVDAASLQELAKTLGSGDAMLAKINAELTKRGLPASTGIIPVGGPRTWTLNLDILIIVVSVVGGVLFLGCICRFIIMRCRGHFRDRLDGPLRPNAFGKKPILPTSVSDGACTSPSPSRVPLLAKPMYALRVSPGVMAHNFRTRLESTSPETRRFSSPVACSSSSYIAQKYRINMCGEVGITFDQEKDKNDILRVFVKKISPGSPAENGFIEEGDTVVTVFGQHVYGLSMTKLRQVIYSQEGKYIKIGFQKQDGTRTEFDLNRRENNDLSDASFAIKDGRQSASSSPSRWTSPVNTSGGVDNVSGWEKTLDPEGFVFWVNHQAKTISYTRPKYSSPASMRSLTSSPDKHFFLRSRSSSPDKQSASGTSSPDKQFKNPVKNTSVSPQKKSVHAQALGQGEDATISTAPLEQDIYSTAPQNREKVPETLVEMQKRLEKQEQTIQEQERAVLVLSEQQKQWASQLAATPLVLQQGQPDRHAKSDESRDEKILDENTARSHGAVSP